MRMATGEVGRSDPILIVFEGRFSQSLPHLQCHQPHSPNLRLHQMLSSWSLLFVSAPNPICQQILLMSLFQSQLRRDLKQTYQLKTSFKTLSATVCLNFRFGILYLLFNLSSQQKWRGQWHRTPVLLPGKSHGWRAWWAALHGVAQSRI